MFVLLFACVVDLEGLQRKLSRKLSPDEGSDNSDEIEWEVINRLLIALVT